MPPPVGANLASLGSFNEKRRSSSSATIYDVREIVTEAFNELDLDGNGNLDVNEVEVGLKKLLSLKDPRSETDSICE